ncbi:MAG: hypothetical protein RBU21_13615 [FCB group bacterium]|jgi:hypothetical protein|nr:hypothetical protein [FCB group bacterium]
MEVALKTVYAAFCLAGIAIDLYSCVCYVVRHRRSGPPPIPLAGLILYVLAGSLRSFTNIGSLFVQWELLVLVALHVVCHLIVPWGDRLLLRPVKHTSGDES